jgi:MFS superfamily sulfate permease-like transporter
VVILRYAYLLAMAVWLGGMVSVGAVVAPSLFQTLQAVAPVDGRALAGEAFKAILSRFHFVAYGCGTIAAASLVAMALLGPRPRHFGVRLALVMAMLAIALYSGLRVLTEIDSIQAIVGTLPSRLPAADPRRIRFDSLHQLATRLMMVNIVGALGLLWWDTTD